MKDWEIVMLRIKDYIRRNEQTSYGKNQLLKFFDEMEDKLKKEGF